MIHLPVSASYMRGLREIRRGRVGGGVKLPKLEYSVSSITGGLSGLRVSEFDTRCSSIDGVGTGVI